MELVQPFNAEWRLCQNWSRHNRFITDCWRKCFTNGFQLAFGQCTVRRIRCCSAQRNISDIQLLNVKLISQNPESAALLSGRRCLAILIRFQWTKYPTFFQSFLFGLILHSELHVLDVFFVWFNLSRINYCFFFLLTTHHESVLRHLCIKFLCSYPVVFFPILHSRFNPFWTASTRGHVSSPLIFS